MKIAYDLRAQDNAALEAIIGRMKLAAAGLEGSFGAKASCEVTEYCPGPEYDEALGELFKETVAGTFGKEALGANCEAAEKTSTSTRKPNRSSEFCTTVSEAAPHRDCMTET